MKCPLCKTKLDEEEIRTPFYDPEEEKDCMLIEINYTCSLCHYTHKWRNVIES